MKITIGEWKTRDGRKAIVGAINESAKNNRNCIGWVNGEVWSWNVNGEWLVNQTHDLDLIAPWADPVPWDWSTTPPWINWIAKERDGDWYMCSKEPILAESFWDERGYVNTIPGSHSPKWSGDWKLSKTQRPKEVAK